MGSSSVGDVRVTGLMAAYTKHPNNRWHQVWNTNNVKCRLFAYRVGVSSPSSEHLKGKLKIVR